MRSPIRMICLLLCLANARANQLSAGPMVGAVEMREASVWLRTSEAADVQVAAFPSAVPSDEIRASTQTTAEADFTGVVRLGPLLPGTTYQYRVFISGQEVAQELPKQFRTPPDFRNKFPPTDARFALIGGHYVNDRPFDPLNRIPGGGYEVFEAIRKSNPDLVFWLGNTAHLRDADIGSHSGTLYRYSRARSIPELAPLLAAAPHQAIWGAEDSGIRPHGGYQIAENWTRPLFRKFWTSRSWGLPKAPELNCTVARWSDVEFYLLDDRSHRDLTSLAERNRVIFGEKQLDWLLDELEASQATFKIIMSGTAIANPADGPGNMTVAVGERDEFLKQLTTRDVDGVVFANSAKSHGEMTKMVRSGGYDLWEITVGATTSRPSNENRELNYFRQPGSTVLERHFAVVRVHGPEGRRQLDISAHRTDGSEIWTQTLSQSLLSD